MFSVAVLIVCSWCPLVTKDACLCVCQLFSWVGDTRRHYMLLAAIVGLMSVAGWSNLQHQWNISGEYQNVPTEQLMDWINENTLPRECTAVGASCPVSLVFTKHCYTVHSTAVCLSVSLSVCLSCPVLSCPRFIRVYVCVFVLSCHTACVLYYCNTVGWT